MPAEQIYVAHVPGGTRIEQSHGALARSRILAEATAMFADRGFHGVTIRDLAARAGVNIAAINYHFRSKEDLHAAVIDTALSQWSSEVLSIETLGADAGLEAVLHHVMSALIAPVIDRDHNHLVLRLLAWNILESSASHLQGRVNAFAIVLSQLLAPYLPRACGADDSVLLAQWLVGQCLLISPALRPGHAALEADLAKLIDTSVKLAIGGLGSMTRTEA